MRIGSLTHGFVLSGALVLLSCSSQEQNAGPESPAPRSAVRAKKPIEMSGREWTFGEPYRCQESFTMAPDMEGSVYRCEDSNLRLFVLERPQDATHDWRSMRFIEKRKANGQWVREGCFEEWFVDGERRLATYKEGKLHGKYSAWYPNGQLHVRDTYVDGHLEGLSEGWYADGTKQYEAAYSRDREISGKFWNEDGTLGSN